ncbi:hypothetical protein LJ739_02000 [Aestuariibacter halophilus]|uniref:Type VI secretion system lipoprotein TssJ n=1 Tax=Fluctibacter halophilus TaxID=226011 RepID=A0ABS8G3A9_9ALTE|nr:hypothetical protein [Aestuariibacter halophilus]MCC2615013.1 hypothetical protein [Aestuariibacter halophilus]
MSLLRVLLLCAITSVLLGCSALQAPWSRANGLERLSVQMAPSAQLRYALSVDVLFVYDQQVLDVIAPLNAQQWFESKAAFQSMYGQHLRTVQMQLVTGVRFNDITLPDNHHRALAVLAFANDPGNPNTKVILTEQQAPLLIFDGNELLLREQP